MSLGTKTQRSYHSTMKLHNLVALVCLVALPVCADDLPDLGDAAQATFSPTQERKLGEKVMQEIRRDPSYFDDTEVVDYLSDLGYRLVSNSPDARQEFTFFLIRDNTINAFALPGGFVGVHTGLLLAAETESELASVLAHEIAHVTQKHLVQMIAAQKRATLPSLAGLALAILAARSNPDLAQAAIAISQGAIIQTQLNFTRDHEHEADRVGLQVLHRAGFDMRAMPIFFERMQKSNRFYEGNAPTYLRTHPLTYERIADLQNRIEATVYKQVEDNKNFQIIRAKLRANLDKPQEALMYFDDTIKGKKYVSEAAARYGLVTALLQVKNYTRAEQEIIPLRKIATANPLVEALAARLKVAAGKPNAALDVYREALKSAPRNRTLIYELTRLLIQTGRNSEALALVSDQLVYFPNDYRLYELQAEVHAASGKAMLQHKSQAEAYVRQGSVSAAIDQLQIALRSNDGDFYLLSSVEARLRELQTLEAETRKQE
jgi:beta-barrel assembly-enhancing protease